MVGDISRKIRLGNNEYLEGKVLSFEEIPNFLRDDFDLDIFIIIIVKIYSI